PTLATACTAVDCGETGVYMNAIETDPGVDPTKEPTVPAFVWYTGACAVQCDPGNAPAAPVYKWFVPLQPALQLGLDFELTNKGTITWPIGSSLPLSGATLSGQIIHYGPPKPTSDRNGINAGLTPSGNATVIARIEGGAAVDVPAQGTAVLTGTVIPLPGGDYI